MCNFNAEYDLFGGLAACSQQNFKNLLSEIESVGNFGYKSLLKMYCFNE